MGSYDTYILPKLVHYTCGLKPTMRQREKVRRWQDRMTPVWKRLGGGCHLNRKDLVEGLPQGGKVHDRSQSEIYPARSGRGCVSPRRLAEHGLGVVASGDETIPRRRKD